MEFPKNVGRRVSVTQAGTNAEEFGIVLESRDDGHQSVHVLLDDGRRAWLRREDYTWL